MKSKYDYPEGRRYYDDGWNSRCRGEPLALDKQPASSDFIEGWKDCDEAPEEDRQEMS